MPLDGDDVSGITDLEFSDAHDMSEDEDYLLEEDKVIDKAEVLMLEISNWKKKQHLQKQLIRKTLLFMVYLQNYCQSLQSLQSELEDAEKKVSALMNEKRRQ